MSLTRITGPPGTGKTTTAMQIISQNEDKRIAFISYTKSAIKSATERLDFGLYNNKENHFRTLHSLCSKLLKLDELSILTSQDINKWAESLNLTEQQVETFLSIYDYQRNAVIPDKHLNLLVADINKYKTLRKEYEKFKKELHKFDYTDIIYYSYKFKVYPPVDLLIIDEAQDLSRLQWMLVNYWITKIPETIIIGDDDQTIYSHLGADPTFFIKLNPKKHRELLTSYRLAKNIYKFSKKVIEKNKNRIKKNFKPHNENPEGSIIYTSVDVAINQSLKENKSLFILYRNRRYFKEAEEYLIKNYIPFSYIEGSRNTAFLIYKAILENHPITAEEIKTLLKEIKLNQEEKKKIKKALFKYNQDDIVVDEPVVDDLFKYIKSKTIYQLFPDKSIKALNYWEFVLSKYKYYEIADSPIKIGTIHSSKGLEADNVYLSLKQTKKTYLGSDIETERRIFYVGITRAKEKVFIPLDNGKRQFYL